MTGATVAWDTLGTSVPAAGLQGRRAAMVSFSHYPGDPRPRRTAEALAHEGMTVDVIAISRGGGEPSRDVAPNIDVLRLPLEHRRAGKIEYLGRYAAFIAAAFGILAVRSVRRRYDLVYVNNMPDVLVLSALVPKICGAKVILDLHDPMPELMTTIFGAAPDGRIVRGLALAEKHSIALADQVLTVNEACRRRFAARSCDARKIEVVMNAPDDAIFGFRTPDEAAHVDGRASRFSLMYHGTLVERAGLDVAVDGLARVKRAAPAAELNVYGRRTPFLDRVLEQARVAGISDAVHFHGPRSLEQIVDAIDACDVGIVSNRQNPFTELATPTRLFEYLSRGKPVIAPRSVATLDYFTDESMLFFTPGDASELARRITDVFHHPRATREIVRRGQAVYRAHTWPRERARLIEIVSRLLLDGSHRVQVPAR